MATSRERVIVWRPQPGPQTRLLTCPISDIFYGGARGGGKTYGGIGKWLKHEKKHGKKAKGIVFRRTMPELEEFQARCREILPKLGWRFAVQARTWTAPSGATLKLRFLEHDSDADKYQGHEYTFMLFEELGNFPNPEPIDALRACLRSSDGIPVEFLATGNPGGVGHGWIKKRYVDPSPANHPFYDDEARTYRVFIPARLEDNQLLVQADPGYRDRLYSATLGRPWLRKNWLEGDWDAVPESNPFPHVQYHDGNVEWDGLNLYWVIDMAYTRKKGSDYTASLIWGADSQWNLYELAYWEEQAEAGERLEHIFQTAQLWGPRGLGILHLEAHTDWFQTILPQQMELHDFWFAVKRLEPRGVPKADRIRDALLPNINRLHFKPGSKLAERLLGWNDAVTHGDDGPDGLAYLVMEADRGRVIPEPEPNYDDVTLARIRKTEADLFRPKQTFRVVR